MAVCLALLIFGCRLVVGQGGGAVELDAIRIEGLRSLPEMEVLALLEARAGRHYGIDSLTADRKALWESRLFSRVAAVVLEHPTTGTVLYIEVSEQPRVDDIDIQGNDELTGRELREVLGLERGDVALRDVGKTVARRIVRKYHAQGFWDAEVTVDSAPTSQGLMLTFRIDEGRRVWVRGLRFVGNRRVDTEELREIVAIRPTSWPLSWLTKRRFDPDRFTRDLERIREHYRDLGYLGIEVKEGPHCVDPENQDIYLVIEIDEGRPHVLVDVEFERNLSMDDAILREPFNSLLGEPLSAGAFRKALEEVRGVYTEPGRYFTTIQPRYLSHPEDDKVEVRARIDVTESTRYRIGQSNIRRHLNPKRRQDHWFYRLHNKIAPPLLDEVIRRELELTSGSLATETGLHESRRNLRQLGLMQDLELRLRRRTDIPQVADLVVSYREQDTGAAGLEVGYAQPNEVYTTAYYRQANLRGRGDSLEVRADLSTLRHGVGITHTDRRVLMSDWSWHTRLEWERHRRLAYTLNAVTLNNALVRRFADNWRYQANLRLGYAGFAHVLESIRSSFPDYAIGSLRTGIEYNSRNDEHWPTAGGRFNGTVEAGDAGGAFSKLRTLGECFWRYKWLPIVATRAELVGMPQDARSVGITERVFLGGLGDLRGFAWQGIGPVFAREDRIRSGGSAMYVARSELRFPIFRALKGHVFMDAGSIAARSFAFGPMRSSAGTGLRVIFPPRLLMELDIARALAHEKGDNQSRFQFGMSLAF